MTEIIKHTSLADFSLDEYGQLACSLNINFTEFDVDVQQYLKGDDEITEQEYELIYKTVDKKCHESEEYMIDCFNDRYTVRKISEIEQIHYEAMSDEEKSKYDEQKIRQALEIELAKCERELQSLDYIGVKIATGRATKEEYAEQIARMNELADRINELKAGYLCPASAEPAKDSDNTVVELYSMEI